MLQELTIRNFALLEDVRVAFGRGLNVLTGETGAGKSIIIDAIGAVLGARTTADAIRTGTDRAQVEAIFELAAGDAAAPGLRLLLEEAGLLDEGEDLEQLILARELTRSGRSVARVNGRAVPAAVLAQVGQHLVDIHGQHEHLSLLRGDAQRDLLDRYGGLTGPRGRLAARVREVRALRAQLAAMHQDEREVARRVDLLSFQIEEIQAARLQPGEEELLDHEQTLLVNAVRLAELATSIYEQLAGGGVEVPSALDLLGRASRDLSQLTRIDRQAEAYEQALAEATAQVDELGRTFRAYREAIEFTPERLQEVNDRLELIHNLKRKYGATVEEVLAFGERAAAELDTLVNREARTAELQQRLEALEAQIGKAAEALSAQRGAAGERMAAAVAQELRDLSLGGEFAVALSQHDDPAGIPFAGRRVRFDESGADTVEFLFAPNPGEPAKAVARTASGGELSRILLALKAVLTAADRTPTLIFDEVDSGIGGRSGAVLGQKLAGLAGRHQVLCVTHLPQIAAFGDAHFYISKEVRDGRTATSVTPLDDAQRAQELAQMLGGVTATTLAQARQLREGAHEWRHKPDHANGTARPRRRQAVPQAKHALEGAQV